MTSNPKPTPLLWYCVLDRLMRQIYLGIDEAEATKLAVDGTVMQSGTTRGDAIRSAALAYEVERRKRLRSR